MANPVLAGSNGGSEGYWFGPRFVLASTIGLKLVAGITAGNARCSFRRALVSGSAGYAITAAKTFTCYGCIALNMTATAIDFAIGYSDNDVGWDSGTVFTNPKAEANQTLGAALAPSIGYLPATAGTYSAFPIDLTIPATKFPALSTQGAGSLKVWLYGTES